ncbi:cupin domain-containing protein [Haliscomenobacter hydrossis]|uniref:Cupin 2 conserved barrel domain protein n=1 Tax=Haliscomenobacter hydrossis (strain ATCC 27775 / DSM 1100 / LMG 10767 / O) TaxID=760192 RepID=F4L781_HALH1|nr:cupin domain-containing protein [Haliscomenobacter hydrossis]AEE53108.1 Cupin 2 conserved barrel domain protein [Haliscomenobacter hydrossis DSM 1100]
MQRRKFLTSTTLVATAIGVSAKSLVLKKDKKPFVVKNGEARFGVHTPFRGVNPNDVKISGKDTNGQLAVFEYIGTEKTGPSLHLHFDQDEIFCIIEGEYRFQVGDQQEVLSAGDTIFLPRQIPHTWIQLSDQGKLLYMVQPAGKLEEFFVKMNSFKVPPSAEEMQRISNEHGMKNVGPPLTLK